MRICASAVRSDAYVGRSEILAGIALNESAYNGRAWPWTLNVAGRGFFFRTREDAFKAIRISIANGRCDFDVGMMQINRNLWSCYITIRASDAGCSGVVFASQMPISIGFNYWNGVVSDTE